MAKKVRVSSTNKVVSQSDFRPKTEPANENESVGLFRCVLASLYEGLSVRPSVGPSIRRSVGRSRFRKKETFVLTMYRGRNVKKFLTFFNSLLNIKYCFELKRVKTS